MFTGFWGFREFSTFFFGNLANYARISEVLKIFRPLVCEFLWILVWKFSVLKCNIPSTFRRFFGTHLLVNNKTNLFGFLCFSSFVFNFSNFVFNPFRDVRNGVRYCKLNGQHHVLKNKIGRNNCVIFLNLSSLEAREIKCTKNVKVSVVKCVY